VSTPQIELPDELLRRIYDQEFGFPPTNRSMKPVHVANGLSRRLVGTTTSFTPLARVLRQYVQKQAAGYLEERHPNASILKDYGDRFSDAYGNTPSDEDLTAFRALAKETLGADGAAFDSGQSSFTLSHRDMITTDISDNGSGDLLAALLVAGGDQRPSPGADLVRVLLEQDTDPWTMIGWPILDVGDQSDATLLPAALLRSQRVAELLATDGNGVLTSPTLRVLRERYDQLAAYEERYGAKLTTLRRMVLFGSFVIHVHMIRRGADVISTAARPPILIDMFDGRRRSLREASAATLQAGFRSIEQLVMHRIRMEIEEAFPKPKKVGTYLDSLADSPDKTLLTDEYEAHVGTVGPIEALAEAYWKAGYSGVGPKSVKGFPWHALLALGRRSGYLLPYDDRGRGGKEHKRYGLNAEFAEILVASVVAPGEPIDFDEFLDQLRESYGIVIGRQVDFDVIRRNDLRSSGSLQRSVSVNENDLRLNIVAFKDLMLDIGLAKTYADGRTVITTDEGRAR
jgi:hypothetical protein